MPLLGDGPGSYTTFNIKKTLQSYLKNSGSSQLGYLLKKFYKKALPYPLVFLMDFLNSKQNTQEATNKIKSFLNR